MLRFKLLFDWRDAVNLRGDRGDFAIYMVFTRTDKHSYARALVMLCFLVPADSIGRCCQEPMYNCMHLQYRIQAVTRLFGF
jgi:hypothetical protein